MPTPTQAEVAIDMAYQAEHRSDSRVPEMMVAFIVSLVLAHIAVALRFYARRIKQQPYLWDDWIALASAIITTAFIVLMMVMAHMGYGHHAITITSPAANTMGLLFSEVLYSISIALIKTSTLFLLHRVFPSAKLVPYLWTVGVLVHAYSMVLSVTIMTQCRPLAALWVPELAAHATCIPMSTIFIVTSALNALTDLMLMALPMPFLWKLNMDVKRKLQLTGIFVCGGAVFAISIARAPMLVNVSATDPSWSDVNGGIWSAVEAGVGTLCACLPTLGVLFTAIRQRTKKSSSYHYRLDDGEEGQRLAGRTPGHSDYSKKSKGSMTGFNGPEVRVMVRDGKAHGGGDVVGYGFAMSDMGTPKLGGRPHRPLRD